MTPSRLSPTCRRRPSTRRSGWLAGRLSGALIAVAAIASSAACNHGTPETTGAPGAPGTPAKTDDADAGTSTAAEQPAALVDLEGKLRPSAVEPKTAQPTPSDKGTPDATANSGKTPATPPTPTTPESARLDEKAATAAFETAMKDFGAKIAAGDLDGASRHLLSPTELKASVLTPTGASIVGDSVYLKNRQVLRVLIDSLKGKTVTTSSRTGSIGYARPKGVMRENLPLMSQGKLDLTSDGTLLVLTMAQLVWVDGAWKVFQLEL